MRSVIKEANSEGIEAIVAQQFEMGIKISNAGFIPILEPEIDVHAPDKKDCEVLLKKVILAHLSKLDNKIKIMFKLTLPNIPEFYEEANKILAKNHD